MIEATQKDKISALKKQIRAMQEQRMKIENFDKKVKMSTNKWVQELRKAKKLVTPGEILPVNDTVRVRIETAEFKITEFSENQKVLRNNYKLMTDTVYQMFKEIECSLNSEDKIKFERQIKYCANF